MGLFTSNAPSAKFAKIGDTVEGTIVDVYRSQRYEYVRGGQGLPLYWQNRKPTAGARIDRETGKPNDPVLQTVITLDTGVPDEHGDPERRLFIKSQRMDRALTAAVTLAGGRRIGGLLLGGYLRCTWTGEEDGDGPQPAKVYAFEYAAPPAGAGREPSAEVRLAEREEPATPVLPQFGSGATPSMGIARPFVGHGGADQVAPPREALATARQGVRDTDVSAGTRLAATIDDDEPPF